MWKAFIVPRIKQQYFGLCVIVVAFVFNWLGFFAAYCMTKTVAGRYGAISGFGLSVVKWVLILKVRIYL